MGAATQLGQAEHPPAELLKLLSSLRAAFNQRLLLAGLYSLKTIQRILSKLKSMGHALDTVSIETSFRCLSGIHETGIRCCGAPVTRWVSQHIGERATVQTSSINPASCRSTDFCHINT